MEKSKYKITGSFILSLLMLTFFISACQPLQQAPLVYSSTAMVGLDIKTATADQPGFTANIGYKIVDAAYVPIAVAKPCDNNKTDCTADVYTLQQIKGNNNVGNEETDADNTLIDKFKLIIVEKDTATKKLEAAQKKQQEVNETILATLNDLDSHYNYIADKDNREVAIASLQTNIDNLSTDIDNLNNQEKDDAILKSIAEKQRKKDNLILLKNNLIEYKQAKTDISTADNAIKTTDDKLKNFNMDKLASALKQINNKTDAYSVFGSFEGNTNIGGGKNANVKLGKVFSTGVAAQNLTEGLGKYYTTMSNTKCVTEGIGFINSLTGVTAAEKSNLSQTLFKACSSQQ
ncbi:MAG: hypothetical protein JRJ44_04735 [Deltaproteobacteria bacterium]|nr:hypothetical protein [Deltaproteobacteria bacterium]